MKKVGYWQSDSEQDLPHPRLFVDYSWNPVERNRIIQYLERGDFYQAYKGSSLCRFCKCLNGSHELTDHVYIWPSGFAHYLEKHNVKPDEEFLVHVRRNNYSFKKPEVDLEKAKGLLHSVIKEIEFQKSKDKKLERFVGEALHKRLKDIK